MEEYELDWKVVSTPVIKESLPYQNGMEGGPDLSLGRNPQVTSDRKAHGSDITSRLFNYTRNRLRYYKIFKATCSTLE